jgi:hypothetical protein
MGEFATGGYSIQMRTVRDTGTRIEVVVVQRRPGPGDLTTDAFSQPYDILVIPKPNKPIAFVR